MTNGDPVPQGEPAAKSGEPLADSARPSEQPVAPESAERTQTHRGWPWWPWLLLVGAAVLGLILGAQFGSREGSLFGDETREAKARPTIVIAARPMASPVVSPPSAVASPVAEGEREYVVQAGDSLRSIAQRAYGDVEFWTRLYERNREVIGPDPNALRPGMRLQVPAN